jgi:hypothetical protein
MDDGRGVDLGGGVDGAGMRFLEDPGRAGEGEVARYINKFASSSPVRPLRTVPEPLKPFCRSRADRAIAAGGVRGARGGEERT